MRKQQHKKRAYTRPGVYKLVRFGTESELAKIDRAATVAHANLRAHLGRYWPNASLFIAQAALEKAEKILAK